MAPGNHTLTQLETRAIEFNVDGLPPVTPEEVERACGEIIELLGALLRRGDPMGNPFGKAIQGWDYFLR